MSKLTDFRIFNEIIRPFLDIAVLSFLIYQMYKILIQTRALQLLKGAVLIVVIYAGSYLLELDTLRWIMNALVTVIVIVIAVVFQAGTEEYFYKNRSAGLVLSRVPVQNRGR